MDGIHDSEDPEKELFGDQGLYKKDASLLWTLRRWTVSPSGCLSWVSLPLLLLLFSSLSLFLLFVAILVQAVASHQIQSDLEEIRQQMAEMNSSLAGLCHPCPLGWEHFQGTCYFFSRSKNNWNGSVAACQARMAQLVIINSKEEEKFLQSWEDRSKKRTWIGLSDHHNEGSWRWVDGSPLGLSFWNEGEPNNISEEDCAEYYGNGWNDSLCHLSKDWVCEKPASTC